jgi:hypothetical protein
MQLITDKITIAELKQLAQNIFGNFVKVVVDIEKGIMVVDAELHADEEALLLEQGSKQANLWGINIYPEASGDDRIEFNSMINIKPHQNNRTRGIDSVEIQAKILQIVNKLIAL